MLGQVLNYVSGRKASKEQERSNQRALELLERQYEEGKQARADFLAGDEYSNLMSILSGNQVTPNFTSYQDFASSDQANQGVTNASRRALNAFSGMGNFGSTGSFADLVRTQDSTLGNLFNANRQMEMDNFNVQRALRGDRVNEALIPLNIRQSLLDANQTAGVNYANTQGQHYMDQGTIRAGRAMLPAQTYNQTQQQANNLAAAFFGG